MIQFAVCLCCRPPLHNSPLARVGLCQCKEGEANTNRGEGNSCKPVFYCCGLSRALPKGHSRHPIPIPLKIGGRVHSHPIVGFVFLRVGLETLHECLVCPLDHSQSINVLDIFFCTWSGAVDPFRKKKTFDLVTSIIFNDLKMKR